MRTIADNSDIKGNNSNSGTNTPEDEKNRFAEGANKAANVAKNAASKAQNAKKIANGAKGNKVQRSIFRFILTHLPAFIPILVAVIAAIIIISLYGFFSSMPGMFMGKIQQGAKDLWHWARDAWWKSIVGYFVPKSEHPSKDEMVELAQYLEDMGYSVTGYGFADVKYKEGSDDDGNSYSQNTDTGKTKQIDKVTKQEYVRNNIQAYLAANEETYDIAQGSILGSLEDKFDSFRDIITGNGTVEDLSNVVKMGDVFLAEGGDDKSSGLINLGAQNGKSSMTVDEAKNRVSIDRENQSMEVYTSNKVNKAFDRVHLFGFSNVIRFFFGAKYTYDLSDWTAKYGRPTEMFIALHLATMMPDLTYQIAASPDFNTKVNISFQHASVQVDDIEVNVGGSTITKNDILQAFINYYKGQIPPDSVKEVDSDSDEEKAQKEKERKKWNELKNDISGLQGDINKSQEFLQNIQSRFHNMDIVHATEAVTGKDYGLSSYEVEEETSSPISGLTLGQAQELANMISKGKFSGDSGGIEDVDIPYIDSVTKHWFYNDIYFTESKNNDGNGVYNRAAQATKKITYHVTDDDDELKGLDITMDVTLSNTNGILYQVNEPVTSGPNNNIVNLFNQKYYKYDGTNETAKKIAVAKLLDNGHNVGDTYIFTGEKNVISSEEKDEYDDKNLAKKQKPNFGSASDTLSAFTILKNVHTDASDAIYRMLKELATSEKIEGSLEEGSLNEELKKVLIWPFSRDGNNVTGKGKGTVTKDPDNYGIIIKDVKGQAFLAPGDGEITESGDGSFTIKLGKLSSDTMEILKFIYEDDFYNISEDEVNGMTMTIKGVTPSASGAIKRGNNIGSVTSDEVTIVMQHIDKSLVGDENDTTDDDVEQYINQDYTLEDENEAKQRMEAAKRVAKYATGNMSSSSSTMWREDLNMYVDYHTEGAPLNPAQTEGTTDDQRYQMYCVVAAEAGGNYDGALAVITSAYNRAYGQRKAAWSSYGSTIYSQLMGKSQYSNPSWKGVNDRFYENYAKYYEGRQQIPEGARQAVDDCLDSGKINHGFDSFRTYRSQSYNWVMNNVSAAQRQKTGFTDSNKYIREIGGNAYFNSDSSPEYYTEIKGGMLLESAKNVHDQFKNANASYGRGSNQVDCSMYVSRALKAAGYSDIGDLTTYTLPGYFRQHSDTIACVEDGQFFGDARNAPLQPGDIVFIGYNGETSEHSGHVQIFRGYENGTATWYNAGSTEAIQRDHDEYNGFWGGKGIVGIWRVTGPKH